MNQYRPYNSYKPVRRVQKEAVQRNRWQLSLKKASLFGLIFFILIMAVKIDTAARAAAREAEQASLRAQSVQTLQKQVESIAGKYPQIDFSVSMRDKKYSLSAEYQPNKIVDAASTTKLISAILYLHNQEQGVYKDSHIIDGRPAKRQLKEMIKNSSDTQWHNFNQLLTHKALERHAWSIGLRSYNAKTNTISAKDMNKLMESLSENRLLNKQNTNLLLSFMQNTNYEEFISPAVSNQHTLHHKVGINQDQVNDTAAIHSYDNDLYITIFTNGNDTYNWQLRAEIIQQIVNAASRAYLE
jgi:beta-lactamase class A